MSESTCMCLEQSECSRSVAVMQQLDQPTGDTHPHTHAAVSLFGVVMATPRLSAAADARLITAGC